MGALYADGTSPDAMPGDQAALLTSNCLVHFAGMTRGSKPGLCNVRLTKCALIQASNPIIQRGSFSNIPTSAMRLILRRTTILPP